MEQSAVHIIKVIQKKSKLIYEPVLFGALFWGLLETSETRMLVAAEIESKPIVESCPSLYDMVGRYSLDQEVVPASDISESFIDKPPSREMGLPLIPPGDVLEFETRIAKDLGEVLFPNTHAGQGENIGKYYPPDNNDPLTYFKFRLNQISVNIGNAEFDLKDKKLSKAATRKQVINSFAKINQISAIKAQAALETLEEIKKNPVAAASAFKRMIERIPASYEAYRDAVRVRDVNYSVPLAQHVRSIRSDMSHEVLMGRLSSISYDVNMKWWNLKSWARNDPIIYKDTRTVNKLRKILLNDLKRSRFEQVSGHELEEAWEAWEKEPRKTTGGPNRLASENSMRLLDVSTVMSYFQSLELLGMHLTKPDGRCNKIEWNTQRIIET